jgi:hypothetical protein
MPHLLLVIFVTLASPIIFAMGIRDCALVKASVSLHSIVVSKAVARVDLNRTSLNNNHLGKLI